MVMRPNPRSFLTGADPFFNSTVLDSSPDRSVEEIAFDLRHEGFIGIPHGGLGMGLCLDAWRKIGEPRYPVDVRFRFGGSGILIGDSAEFVVERAANGRSVVASITKIGDKTPYVKAEITPAAHLDVVAFEEPPAADFRSLPYYRNCFVCGHHRSITGLQRRFRVHGENGAVMVTTPWGYDPNDYDRAASFLIGEDELHPAVLISIFDENTAWGGFMATRSCGLSVRVEFKLLRPVLRSEKLLFVSRPSGIRGNPKAPRFFLAEGTVFSMADAGHPEPVATGRGEWLIVDHYTKQIQKNLLPEGDWQWIFADEENG
ncbi:MAG TPA: hypothetical protein VK463_19215 [Desulfomonilaceae bacterium]|nr:hypothetical protein [Desulfomonilaceae bacterium]